jgi:hypothetical protein
MAGLVSIAQPGASPKGESTFDKVAKSLAIANSVLGTALDVGKIYETHQANALKSQDLQQNLAINFVKTNQEDPAGFQYDHAEEGPIYIRPRDDTHVVQSLQTGLLKPISKDDYAQAKQNGEQVGDWNGIVYYRPNLAYQPIKALGLQAAQETRSSALENKMSDQDEKDRQALVKNLEYDKASGRTTVVGRAANNLFAANKVESLTKLYPDLNQMPPQQVHELANAFNQLVSPGNPNVTIYEDIVPKSAWGNVSAIENYLTNNPGGANQGKFVDNLLKSVSVEKQAASNQIQGFIDRYAKSQETSRFYKRRPEDFKQIVGTFVDSLKSQTQDQTGQVPAPAGSAPDFTKMTPDQLREYIRKGQ